MKCIVCLHVHSERIKTIFLDESIGRIPTGNRRGAVGNKHRGGQPLLVKISGPAPVLDKSLEILAGEQTERKARVELFFALFLYPAHDRENLEFSGDRD